jgi:hypothetical protein
MRLNSVEELEKVLVRIYNADKVDTKIYKAELMPGRFAQMVEEYIHHRPYENGRYK